MKLQAREDLKLKDIEIRAAREEAVKTVADKDAEIAVINEELAEMRDKRDQLYDEKYKLEAVIDQQKAEIEKLETDLMRAKDEVNCRKMVIDEMSNSMLLHEQESMDMAAKLTLMKNQILEADAEAGMKHRYAAVRLGTIRHHPCTVSNPIQCNAPRNFDF